MTQKMIRLVRAITLVVGGSTLALGCGTSSSAARQDAPQRSDAPSEKSSGLTGGARSLSSGARPPPRHPSPEAYRSVLRAELLHLEGDLPGAVEAIREAVVHDPQSVFLRVRLGQLHLSVGDTERALEAAKAARTLDPEDLEALRLQAAAESLTGDKDEARVLLARALRLHPGDRPASTLLAELLIDGGEIDEAEQVIDRLMEAEPGATDGYLVLARVFVEQGSVERALHYVERALERDAHSPDALELKIDLLYASGRFDDVEPPLRQLVRERGDSRRMRHRLLAGLLLSGKPEAAAEMVDAWIDEDPGEDMLLLLADAHETAGARDRAVRLILAAVPDGRPRSDRLGVRLGRLLLEQRRYDLSARATCELESDPSDEDWTAYMRALCIRAHTRGHTFDEAKKQLGLARAALPTSWRLLGELARLSRTEGSGVSADQLFTALDEARRKRPLDVDLLDVHVRALEDHGRRGQAGAIVDDALRQRPRHSELLMVKARHLERTGKPRAAVGIVEKLMERTERPSTDHLNFAAFTLADHGRRSDHALALAWRAVLREPLNGYIVDTLGWAQLKAGQPKAALATLLRADRLAPQEPEILLHIALTLEEQKEGAEALAFVERAMAVVDEHDPIKPDIQEALARLKRRVL